MSSKPLTDTTTSTARSGRQSKVGTVIVMDVAFKTLVTVAVAPSTVTELWPGVRSNPVPVIVAVAPSTNGSGDTAVTLSVVAVAESETGLPVRLPELAVAVFAPMAGPSVHVA